MKPSRLTVLVGVLAGLLLVRWWFPLNDATGELGNSAVVVPVKRPPHIAADRGEGAVPAFGDFEDLSAGSRDAGEGPVRNPFATRTASVQAEPGPKLSAPTARAAPPSMPVARTEAAAVTDPAPMNQQPPLPPLQVIGSWRDEAGPSVFLVGPQGIVQARVGQTVMSVYRLEQIGLQLVTLVHIPTNRSLQLNVGSAALEPLSQPR